MNFDNKGSNDPESEPEIYSVVGVPPEVLAYAMAKYSRSALSMREALAEISLQKAEQFLNTFYFQYGHRSIADLAHVSFAIERLSMLASIAVVDEQRWDGQERSSRYQDFKSSGYYTPRFPQELRARYGTIVDCLFREYEALSQAAFDHLSRLLAKPSDMSDATYRRTVRARAFDIARYLLPLATNTSVGQIVNARTLESQISRLAAHTHREVRRIAELLKQSASTAPYDLRLEQFRAFIEGVQRANPEVKWPSSSELLANSPVAPTLVKYAEARAYDQSSRLDLSQAAEQLLRGMPISACDRVTLVSPETLEIELAATLIYENSHHPYSQIVEIVSGLSSQRRREIIGLGLKHRGRYDEVARAYAAGQAFQFDILMDVGGFRDLHRHRRCVQIIQPVTPIHGYVVPDEVEGVGRADIFRSLMNQSSSFWKSVRAIPDADINSDADYVLPLAFRRRALFKMDLAEAIYICELRTGAAGHFSYREVAYDMYEEIKKLHPGIASHFRIEDVRKSVDLLKR